jgi:hypothetical protein
MINLFFIVYLATSTMTKKRVSIDTVPTVFVYKQTVEDLAYHKPYWIFVALDSARFKQRIALSANILNPVLHRKYVDFMNI